MEKNGCREEVIESFREYASRGCEKSFVVMGRRKIDYNGLVREMREGTEDGKKFYSHWEAMYDAQRIPQASENSS